MQTRLARRIQTLAAIEIALVLCAAIVAGALFAFGAYIRAVSNELSGTLGQLQSAMTHTALPNARAAGLFTGSLLLEAAARSSFSTQRRA